jgi:hypothetical protein
VSIAVALKSFLSAPRKPGKLMNRSVMPAWCCQCQRPSADTWYMQTSLGGTLAVFWHAADEANLHGRGLHLPGVSWFNGHAETPCSPVHTVFIYELKHSAVCKHSGAQSPASRTALPKNKLLGPILMEGGFVPHPQLSDVRRNVDGSLLPTEQCCFKFAR